MRTATRSFLLLPLLLALALAPSSCRTLVRSGFRSPKIRVVDVALVSPNPFADAGSPWEFALTLEVVNRNDYDLNVSYVAYTATVGRDRVAEGERRGPIRIGASERTLVQVPLSIRSDAIRNAAREALLGRAVAYELSGSVGLTTPLVGVVRVPFSKSGGFNPAEILKRKGFGLN